MGGGGAPTVVAASAVSWVVCESSVGGCARWWTYLLCCCCDHFGTKEMGDGNGTVRRHTTCSRLSKRTRVVIVCPCFVSTIFVPSYPIVCSCGDCIGTGIRRIHMNEALLVSLIASAMKHEA